MATFKAIDGADLSDRFAVQADLFPIPVASRIDPPNGADIAFMGWGSDGDFYFAKEDRSGRPARMQDAIYSNLAKHLGIAVPDWAVLEDERSGETFFGSKRHISTVENYRLPRLLGQPETDELGRRREWLGRYFSALYVLDMFLYNWDRRLENLVLHSDGRSRRLCAIDFASSELVFRGPCDFPIATMPTVDVGRSIRSIHGFFDEAAYEMIELIRRTSLETLKGFVEALPTDWINEGVKEALYGFWAGQAIRDRLEALRSGIRDGSHL